MSNAESAFTKKIGKETTVDKIEGVLEHLNLPPKALAFFRRNYRMIQVVTILVVIAVVSWSLYSSYRKEKIESAASALSLALEQKEDTRSTALNKVAESYSDTTSGLWARVELGHLDMHQKKYKEAAERYGKVLTEVGEKSPLYPLVLFGLAQALEASGEPDRASAEYNRLKDLAGYQAIGYQGMGRIEENKGDLNKAISIYNDFILMSKDDPALAQAVTGIENRVAQLQARK